MNLVDKYDNFGRKNLIPKRCPIDGSPLEILEDALVCESESHNWEIELLGQEKDFYALILVGY